MPHQEAATVLPVSAQTSLNALTMNSLPIITIVTQAGIVASAVRQTSAEHTRSLSAIGSRNLPKSVTRLYFRAIVPSILSVIVAITKIAKAIVALYGVNSVSLKSEKQAQEKLLQV